MDEEDEGGKRQRQPGANTRARASSHRSIPGPNDRLALPHSQPRPGVLTTSHSFPSSQLGELYTRSSVTLPRSTREEHLGEPSPGHARVRFGRVENGAALCDLSGESPGHWEMSGTRNFIG